MARRTLTDSQIRNLSVTKRTNLADPGLAGHYVRVTPSGAKSFACVARDPGGRQHWHTIGSCDHMSLDAAREQARKIIVAIKAGASTAGPETVAAVAANFVKRHYHENGVITAGNKERYLANHILPAWGGRDFRSIKRSDVAKLMDEVSDDSGPVAADEVLSIVRSICTWYATRNDDYTSPIIRGMRRTSNKERARDRVLSDDEIRAIWHAANGTFGSIVKMLLLTGQRRTAVAAMKWEDISIDGAWHCVPGKRQKGRGGELVLPDLAVEIIRQQPRFAYSVYVFTAARGAGHFRAFSDGKAALDRATGPLTSWTLHDLRRTARSLMSRAGVRPDIAERVLGHSQGNIESIYDRHSYLDEKRHALAALASLVSNIVNPIDNVIPLANAK